MERITGQEESRQTVSSRGSNNRGKKAQIIAYMWGRKANMLDAQRAQAGVSFIADFSGSEGKTKNLEGCDSLI